jgi:hypothetical protein
MLNGRIESERREGSAILFGMSACNDLKYPGQRTYRSFPFVVLHRPSVMLSPMIANVPVSRGASISIPEI